MFRQFFDRDRLVMAGLIVLGIMTVAAGFVSGRSTFQYALSTDAQQASAQWVKRADEKILRQSRDGSDLFADQRAVVAAPDKLAEIREESAKFGEQDFRIARSIHEGPGLLAGIDTLFSGWITRLTRFLDADNHVSQIMNFALLDPNGDILIRSEGFDAGILRSTLTESAFLSEFYKSVGMQSTRIIDRFSMAGEEADEFHKALIVPIMSGNKVARVYMLEVDQSSAATMSKVALIAASMMTSLLIVLGYSVPAAVAFRRIRERWKAEDQIRFLAMHDPLTGLSNRVQLQKRLDHAIARAKRKGLLLSVMCIDLDRFKEINDVFGHKAGDALLVEVAGRLRECVRETDIVARLGGDEFVVVVEDLDQPNAIIPVARRICDKLSDTIDMESHQIAISCSVGITFAPSEGSDIQTLLNNADLALYRAKNDGRNTFRFFEPAMDDAIQKRRALAVDLRHALRNEGLHLHYQPHFDLESGHLTGYEALARWTHPRRGEIPPVQFIPIAEESGLIGMLGEWVLETACRYARHWPAATTLSVNISPAQFASQDLASVVRNTLSRTGFPPGRLLLEFTEELLLRNTDETIATLQELTAMGVRLALDDFGSGYSSLSYLTRLPVSKIKIDRLFVSEMENDKDAGAIVSTIIGIGKSLNVAVAAEGVETEAQAVYLRHAGCTEVQGYFFGRPESDVRRQSDGKPLFNHEEEQPGLIQEAIELDTDVAVPPLPEQERGANSLAALLPDAPDPDRELERYPACPISAAPELVPEEAGEATEAEPLQPDDERMAG